MENELKKEIEALLPSPQQLKKLKPLEAVGRRARTDTAVDGFAPLGHGLNHA